MPDQLSAEEIADLSRLGTLYRSLPKADRIYVVSRWDDENGMEPMWKRLNHRDGAPARARQKKLWTTIALIPAAFLLYWVGGLVRADTQRHEDSFVLDYLKDHSENNAVLKSAIAEGEQEWLDLLEMSRLEP